MKNTLVVKADRENLRIELIREAKERSRSISITGATKVEARHSKRGKVDMTVTMWADDCYEEIEISETMAQAILTRDHKMQLSFIDGDEAASLMAWRKRLQMSPEYLARLSEISSDDARAIAAIDKLIAILEKREESPF